MSAPMQLTIILLAIVAATSAYSYAPLPCENCYMICGERHTKNSPFSNFACQTIKLTGEKLTEIVPSTLVNFEAQFLTLQSPAASCSSPLKVELTAESFKGVESVDTVELNCVELSFSNSSSEDPEWTSSIPGIPDQFFAYFPNLRSLSIDHMSIDDLDFDGIDHHLQQLSSLSLNDNNLSDLEADVFRNLSNLVHLNIVNNDLSNLNPDVFNGLGKLRTLSIKNTNISVIRKNTFASLTQLGTLDLQHNQITDIEDGAFDRMPGLYWMLLAGNQLTSFPILNWTNFRRLDFLNLSQNNITALRRKDVVGFGTVDFTLKSMQLKNIEKDAFDGWHLEDVSFHGFSASMINGGSIITTGSTIDTSNTRMRLRRNGDTGRSASLVM